MLLAVMIAIPFSFTYGNAERVYADQITHTSPNNRVACLLCGNTATVISPDNALNPAAEYARLRSSPGLLLGLGSYEGRIELAFPSIRPANSSVYVRINQADGLLDFLLGGSLGSSLANLVASLLLGNQSIAVEARHGASIVHTWNSTDGMASQRTKVVVDKEGNHYLMVTPPASFDRVRIFNKTGALLGIGSEVTLDVYHAFHFSDTSCLLPEFTSFDGTSGLNLELIPTNQNLGNAIDNDISTYSEYSSGLIGVGLTSSLTQYIYFSGISMPSNDVNLAFSFINTLVNVGLLQTALENVTIEAFLGGESVHQETLDSHRLVGLLGLVELDLLTLLGDYGFIEIPLTIDSPFDRIAISYGSFVEINAIGGFRLHEVSVSPSAPISTDDFEMYKEVCAGQSASFMTPSEAGLVFDWYDSPFDGNLLMSSLSGEEVDFENIESDLEFFVSARMEGCSHSSVRGLVKIQANDVPTNEELDITPEGAITIDEWGNFVYLEGQGIVRIVPNYLQDIPGDFNWYWDESLLIPMESSYVDGDGVEYSISDDGTLEIHNPIYKDGDDKYKFFLEYITPQGCYISEEVSFQNLSIILPLEPVFNLEVGIKNDFLVNVKWESDVENGAFVVERADSNLNFEEIGLLKVEEHDGQFELEDDSFRQGNNYYRVKYLSDGINISETELVKIFIDLKHEALHRIYPNPFINNITVSVIGDQNSHDRFVISDMTGKVFMEGEIKEKSISIDDLQWMPSGLYLFKMFSHRSVESTLIIKK